MRHRPLASLLALAACSASLPALAGDGVLEINQTCATQTGCFAGDVAGLPVTIDGLAGHSYRLTSDVDVAYVALAPTNGIEILANDVSLDLGGFAIRGANSCSGTPPVCTLGDFRNSGVVAGDQTTSVFFTGVEVAHGSVVGLGGVGIFLGEESAARDVRLSQNGISGLYPNGGVLLVSGITAFGNGGDGIQVSQGSVVAASTSSGNGSFGIYGSGDVVVAGCSASDNYAGISAGNGAVVTGSTASNNTGSTGSDGIFLYSGSVVSDSAAFGNSGAGINADGSLLIGNSVRANTSAGVSMGSGNSGAYSENSITSNTGGTVISGGGGTWANLGANFCTDAANATVACP